MINNLIPEKLYTKIYYGGGSREHDVLNHLSGIQEVMHTNEHHVIKFIHADNYHSFDYDMVTNRIVG